MSEAATVVSQPVRADIRRQLRLALYDRRISITEVGRQIGLSRGQVSRILNGTGETSFENWEKIAKLAGKRFELVDDR